MRQRSQRARRFETLERRDLLAMADPNAVAIAESFDTTFLQGNLTAEIQWGDGQVTSGEVSRPTGGTLTARIDYSLDVLNFFDTANKRALLQRATDALLANFGDNLAAITPAGGNQWTAIIDHPGTGAIQTLPNLHIAANEIVIFAGGRPLGSSIGSGGPGGFEVSCLPVNFGRNFCETVATRGQPGAASHLGTDVAPWGGSLVFNTLTSWHFGETTAGLESHESDFYSVALHELAHLLGFGTSQAWSRLVVGNVFTGASAVAANGGENVTLSSSGGHWAEGTMSFGQEASLDPILANGTRKLLTPLDLAALDDLGWELLAAEATVTGSHTYAMPGQYDVIVTIEDQLGGSISRQLELSTAPALSLTLAASVILERQGSHATTGTVTRGNVPFSTALVIALVLDDTTASVPQQIVIPAQQDSVSFPIHVIDDGIADGSRVVTLTATAAGYLSATVTFHVAEHSPWHHVARPFDVNGDGFVSPIDALQIINALNAGGSRRLAHREPAAVPPYWDVNDDVYLSPVDALLVINHLNGTSIGGAGEAPLHESRPNELLLPLANVATFRTGDRVTRDSADEDQLLQSLGLRAPLSNSLTSPSVAFAEGALPSRSTRSVSHDMAVTELTERSSQHWWLSESWETLVARLADGRMKRSR